MTIDKPFNIQGRWVVVLDETEQSGCDEIVNDGVRIWDIVQDYQSLAISEVKALSVYSGNLGDEYISLTFEDDSDDSEYDSDDSVGVSATIELYVKENGHIEGSLEEIRTLESGTCRVSYAFSGARASQADTDSDSVADNRDYCLETPSGEAVDGVGCSDSQKDADDDSVSDDLDQCPETPANRGVDENGCANSQKDTDGDLVTDDLDRCPETPLGAEIDDRGCADSQKDTDGDSVTDDQDYCPGTAEDGDTDENGCSEIQFNSKWARVVAKGDKSYAIRNDGALFAWGDNADHLLGLGEESDIIVYSPAQIGTDDDWAQVSTCETHTMAIKEDGSLYGWGENEYGELGLGNAVAGTDVFLPSQIGNNNDWASVATGMRYTLALKNDGSLYAWGANVAGELGLSVVGAVDEPTRVGVDSDWVCVSAGYLMSYGIKEDGSLYGWGWNKGGQLGFGDDADEFVVSPTRIGEEFGWSSAAAGYEHSLAVKDDGSLYGWGDNDSSQLGLGEDGPAYSTSPVRIGSENNWSRIYVSSGSSFGLKDDGALYAWGVNWSHMPGLDSGYHYEIFSPERVGDSNWKTCDIGYNHTLAISLSGNLNAWGVDNFGQLGNGVAYTAIPEQFGDHADWASIDSHSRWGRYIALKDGGTLSVWGENRLGILGLGEGSEKDVVVPEQLPGEQTWVTMATSGNHTLAIDDLGQLFGWGVNYDKQIGLGDDAGLAVSTPTQIGDQDNWVAVAAGAYHSLAVNDAGELYGWGDNGLGMAGIGEGLESASLPTKIDTDPVWVDVFASDYHSFAIKVDGDLYAWGWNDNGVLGVGEGISVVYTPQQIGAVGIDWEFVAPGDNHVLAIDVDGYLYTWGADQNGQLGNGDLTNTIVYTPDIIGEDHDWLSVSAGISHSLAIKEDGSCYAWGNNLNGKLGMGEAAGSMIASPTRIGTANDWESISASYDRSLAVRNGHLYVFGNTEWLSFIDIPIVIDSGI